MGRQQHSTAINRYAYGATFYRYIQEGSTRSAQVIVPLVLDRLKMESVLDVGCGAGAWLTEYRKQGVPVCLGVDGEYVKSSTLLVPPETFIARDIRQLFHLGRSFDLVQCLEVGEHLEPSASRALVANLVNHSDRVLFSAAIPGQGGENHINEQPYEFWRALFAEHGYAPYDFLRPLIRDAAAVESWYRHNVILYVANRSRNHLLPVVAKSQVSLKEPIPDVSSLPYKLRTRILAVLPILWVSRLAVLKHRCILLLRSITGHQYRRGSLPRAWSCGRDSDELS